MAGATWPHNVPTICADESSASDRKMRGAKRLEQRPAKPSDRPSTARSDEIDCVATMGIQARPPRQREHLLVAGRVVLANGGRRSGTRRTGNMAGRKVSPGRRCILDRAPHES